VLYCSMLWIWYFTNLNNLVPDPVHCEFDFNNLACTCNIQHYAPSNNKACLREQAGQSSGRGWLTVPGSPTHYSFSSQRPPEDESRTDF
jgi:hypothetical protein